MSDKDRQGKWEISYLGCVFTLVRIINWEFKL